MKTRMVIDRDVFEDENCIVINFDRFDNELDEATHYGGYARLIKDDENKCFNIVVIDAEGDVLIDAEVPYKFKPVEDI